MSRTNVKLTIATTDYDHFRGFRTGVVNAEGFRVVDRGVTIFFTGKTRLILFPEAKGALR